LLVSSLTGLLLWSGGRIERGGGLEVDAGRHRGPRLAVTQSITRRL